jgi:hypothetical protein
MVTRKKPTELLRGALETRRPDLLFDYPLPIPSDTVYRRPICLSG